MPRLLAIDGNSLGHRAFHSLTNDRLVGPDAAPSDDAHAITAAVLSMVATIWGYGPYDRLMIGFDHAHNRRKALDPDYKSHRAHAPEIAAALGHLITDLDALNVTTCTMHGAEADDILAAAVDDVQRRGWHCDIVSSDRDLIALADDGIRLLRPTSTVAKLVVEDVDGVRRRLGIEPWQYTEVAALRGDPSDGLPGVEGVGQQTAVRLIQTYGSVAALYESLTHLSPKLEARLRAGRPRVEQNLLLMAPIPHLPVSVENTTFDADRIAATLDAWGQPNAARRWRRAVTASAQLGPGGHAENPSSGVPQSQHRPPQPPPPEEPPDQR